MTSARIFVSHSHSDNEWCKCFVTGLQAAGFDTWYDERSLTAGALWLQSIQSELQTREIFLIILTPDSWASSWVQRELQLAMATERQIVPVLYKPTTIYGFLLLHQWIDVVELDCTTAADRVALGLKARQIQPNIVVADNVQLTPTTPTRLPFLPAVLQQLGFTAHSSKSVDVIIPPLCSVPPGTFRMGSVKSNDPQSLDDEMPQHQVMLNDFQIGKYPVTVAEYACAVRSNTVREPPSVGGITWHMQLERLDHPVVCVSWKDAVTYAKWLNDVTGGNWRLPTEAEWEKAARGTDGRIYPWGDQWDTKRANTNENRRDSSTPVGTYPDGASPYGVEDVSGNVWEWCASPYLTYPYEPNANDNNLSITGSRVLRGGSWFNYPGFARASYRGELSSGDYFRTGGFRLARSPGRKQSGSSSR